MSVDQEITRLECRWS